MVALFISNQTVISNSSPQFRPPAITLINILSDVSLVCFLALSVRSDTKPQWLHWICFSCAAYFELLLQFRGCCTSCSCSSSKLGPLASSFGATTNTGPATLGPLTLIRKASLFLWGEILHLGYAGPALLDQSTWLYA